MVSARKAGTSNHKDKTDDPVRDQRVAAIRSLDDASSRIRLMTPELSNDLTEPVAWLTE